MHNQQLYTVEEQISRIERMRLNVFFIILSCMARVVFMYFFFEPISFVIALFLSLFGTLASLKKLKTCLSIYGYVTLIQAIATYCFIIYFGMKNPQTFWLYAIYSLFIVILSVGASSSFSLKKQILNYENYFGDISKFSRKKVVNDDIDLNNVTIVDNTSNQSNQQNNNNNFSNIYNNISSNNYNNNNTQNNNTIPQHYIPSVYSPNNKMSSQPQFIANQSSFIPPSNLLPPMSPPQFHVNFSQQIPIGTPSPVHQIYRSPQFTPQVITTQRNIPKRNVIYHI